MNSYNIVLYYMSIATFKKKSRVLYSTGVNFNTLSVPKLGFSLNGISRVVGSVGPTNLAKSVTRTPFRGTDPVGYGGGSSCRVSGWRARKNKCTSTSDYLVQVHNSGSCCSPQTLVKPSVINTKGMIEKKYMGLLHGTYPKSYVQPGVGDPLYTSQGLYLSILDRKAFSCANALTKSENKESLCNSSGLTNTEPCKYTQPSTYTKTLNTSSYDVYNIKKSAKCTAYHYPYMVNNQACATKA
jgi:hypothetical protein